MRFNLAKIFTPDTRDATGKTFSTWDVLNGRVREVTNEQGEREWRRWKRPKPKKRSRPLCGATCRDGHPCQRRVCVRPDGSQAQRCVNHGGLSTGPKTPKGRQRIAEANRRRAKPVTML
jgi:hypothetical protein